MINCSHILLHLVFVPILFISNIYAKPFARLEIEYTKKKSGQLFIGTYYGTDVVSVDTVKINSSGKSNPINLDHPGIYLIYTSDSNNYEFMVTDTGQYHISFGANCIVLNSNSSSEAFDKHYKLSLKTEHYIKLLKQDTSLQDSKLKIREAKNELKNHTHNLEKKHSGTLLGNYLKTLQPIEIPKPTSTSHTNNDSIYWIKSLQYYRNNYLDNVTWTDYGLIHTPIIERKLYSYFYKVVQQDKDSLVYSISSVLSTIPKGDMHSYCVEIITKIFEKKKHLAIYEYAYLYVLNNYYFQSNISDNQDYYQREYNKLITSCIGSVAPDFSLPDINNKHVSMHNLESLKSVLFFWDLSCPTCQQILLEFSAMLKNKKDIEVISIYMGDDIKAWQSTVNVGLNEEWYNLRLIGKSNIVADYNITSMPTIYVLDENNQIIDKNITVPQLKKYIE